MDGLRTIWHGTLCHKGKVIAELSAESGQDLPISIPSQLDVHQKVKFEEFRDKVVNKTSAKLSVDTYVSHEDHLLLVVSLQAKSGGKVLESFNNFLYKSQSVGVSVVAGNESVIFLVPAKLDTGDIFSVIPQSNGSDVALMYGVIKISKDLVPTIVPTVSENTDAIQVKREEARTDTPKKLDEAVISEATNSPPAPARDLTRLSVYMSNLPTLERHAATTPGTPDKKSPNKGREKKRLSLSQYRKRHDNQADMENNNVKPGETDKPVNDQEEPQNSPNKASNANESPKPIEPVATETSTNSDPIVPAEDTTTPVPEVEMEAVNNKSDHNEGQTPQAQQGSDENKGSSVNIETADSAEVNKDANEEQKVTPMSQNMDSQPTYDAVPNLESTSSPKDPTASTENVVNLAPACVDEVQESKVPTPKYIAESQPQEATITTLPQQEFEVTNKLLIPVTTVKAEKLDLEYNSYTVIEPVDNLPPDDRKLFLGDMDLPHLNAPGVVLESEEEEDHPGDTVKFYKTESVVFTPAVYAKVLDDLDNLKLLLGETAFRNSTAHRERCMTMLDQIGDRLIGNRTRKICENRSLGIATDMSIPSKSQSTKEVQTEIFQNEKPLDGNMSRESVQAMDDRESVSSRESGSGRKKSRPFNKSQSDKRDTDESYSVGEKDKTQSKASRKRKYSEQSDNTDDEAEGYFTMLLKLNGALEDEKRRSKTVRRVQKTSVRRIRKSNVENNYSGAPSLAAHDTESRPLPIMPSSHSTDERHRPGTPEIGAASYEPSPVTLVDGRLRYTKQNSYVEGSVSAPASETQSVVVQNKRSAYQPQPEAIGWHAGPLQQSANYAQQTPTSVPEILPYSSSIASIGQPSQEQFSSYQEQFPVQPTVTHPDNHLPYGQNTEAVTSNISKQPINYMEYSESDIQKSMHDVDLRQIQYQAVKPVPPPPQPPESVPYETTVSSNVVSNGGVTTMVNTTTTETSSYYTDNSVTVYNQEQVIDEGMESEMIDILEILHEGSAPEIASLKKPKGRSKRARKKRRAIAEAEKLYSLVVLAQKIENQQKLNVLSEKQKKREFYKKIIHTYAKRADDPIKPKDQESMILECVEQLMDNPSDTEGSTKTGSTDKKKDDDFALDESDGLSEAAAGKPMESMDCQIIENIRHERQLSDMAGRKGRDQRQRSGSRDRRSYSPERRHKPRSYQDRRPEYRQALVPYTSPESKNQMFSSWSNAKYIRHLFSIADKITYGGDTKSWKNKVYASLRAVASRKTKVNEEIAKLKKSSKSSRNVSFRQRDKSEQELRDAMKEARDFETLESLYTFFSHKFSVLELLQTATKEKKEKPEKHETILRTLCEKLDLLLAKLCTAQRQLEREMQADLSNYDKCLVEKALSECEDMIDNIEMETKNHKQEAASPPTEDK